MDKAIVATAQVSDVSALNDLLTQLHFGESKYYLLQRPDKIIDWTEGTPDTTTIEKFTHGRLFGNAGEIRWRKSVDGYSLLWLSVGGTPEGFKSCGKWKMSESQKIYLLGEGKTGKWHETRIPRELVYPIKPWCKYPCVEVIQYKEKTSQTIRFTRYIKFIGKEGG